MTSTSFTFVDDIAKVTDSIRDMKTWVHFAFDCEGINLSRHGELCIIQTCSAEGKIYVFDVHVLGGTLFDMGMREILENGAVTKYMYDCRNDSDALFHKHGVRLAGVFDLQLMVSILMPRSQFVMGLGKAIDKFLGVKISVQKASAKQMFLNDTEIWKRRPMNLELLQYCTTDVKHLFELHAALLQRVPQSERPLTLRRCRVASDNYTECKRGLVTTASSVYFENAYVPCRIIPAVANGKLLSFPLPADRTCNGCLRSFCSRELNASAKCSMCAAIDRERAT